MNPPRTICFLALGSVLLLVPLLSAATASASNTEPTKTSAQVESIDRKKGFGSKLLGLFGGDQDSKPAPAKAPAAKPDDKSAQAKITGATLMPAGDIKWGPMEGLEGAKQAPLWGDPTKEAHGILYQWPAGTLVPQHTHTFGDRGVVISGTMTLAVDGAPAKKLPPGSYFSLAGGTKHVTGCEEGAPCVFFLQREGKFDVNMVEQGAKK